MTPILVSLASLVVAAPPPGAPDATALLRDSDRARGGLENGISWTLAIESTEDGETTRRSMEVRARSPDALCETRAPARHKGEVYLFNDRAIWFMKPGLRRPIAISPRQRLQGEASNGDVTATNYVRDYQGTIVGQDTIDGQPTWVVELVAKANDVTYDRIRYWILKKEHLGVKAEFLTVAGEVFKTASLKYGNRVKLPQGKEIDFVSVMTIKDAMGAGGATTLTYSEPRAETHAPSMFNVNNLLR